MFAFSLLYFGVSKTESVKISNHVDVRESFPKWFSVFEENDFASGQRLQTFQRFLKAILLLEIQVRLELNERLVLEKK